MFYNCKTCAYFKDNKNQQKCLVNPNIQFQDKFTPCSSYHSEKYYCGFCGTQIYHKELIIDEETQLPICGNCLNQLGTCNYCTNSKDCAFNTLNDPSLPKTIQKTVQQGNTILRQVVKNPQRIEKTCVNCKCYNSAEKVCEKESSQTCGQYSQRPPQDRSPL